MQLNNKLIAKLTTIYHATDAPIFIVTSRKTVFSCCDLAVDAFTDFFISKYVTGNHNDSTAVYCIDYNYYVTVRELSNDCFLLIGPAVPISFQRAYIEEHTRRMFKNNKADVDKLLFYSKRLSEQNLINVTQLVLDILGIDRNNSESEQYNIEYIVSNTKPLEKSLLGYNYKLREYSKIHTPFDIESEVNRCVEAGDFDGILSLTQKSILGDIGTLSFNPERQQRYLFVTSAATISRAAIRGGLDHETAYSIADVCCQEMDKMVYPFDLSSLSINMTRFFCDKVKQSKINSEFSYATRKCITYISQHLHQKITISELAIICEMSTKRLAEKISADLKMPVYEYINREKLKASTALLKGTDLPIIAISNNYQFSTQSYYCKLFKNLYKMTPLQYRKKHRNITCSY